MRYLGCSSNIPWEGKVRKYYYYWLVYRGAGRIQVHTQEWYPTDSEGYFSLVLKGSADDDSGFRSSLVRHFFGSEGIAYQKRVRRGTAEIGRRTCSFIHHPEHSSPSMPDVEVQVH